MRSARALHKPTEMRASRRDCLSILEAPEHRGIDHTVVGLVTRERSVKGWVFLQPPQAVEMGGGTGRRGGGGVT